jgi:hypothetical protein
MDSVRMNSEESFNFQSNQFIENVYLSFSKTIGEYYNI